MDKPNSMSVKDYIIRKQSLRTNTPIKTIEAVIDNQFKCAYEALRTNSSAEISGFGKFLFNRSKALKKLTKYKSKLDGCEKYLLNPEITEGDKRYWEMLKQSNIKVINQIQTVLKYEQTNGVSETNS